MTLVTCSRCGGDGLYRAPSGLGPYCFACKGTGQVKYRAPRAPKVRPLRPTRLIAELCGGDPSKMTADQLSNPRLHDYLGLSLEQLLAYRELWLQGVREVPNPRLENHS